MQNSTDVIINSLNEHNSERFEQIGQVFEVFEFTPIDLIMGKSRKFHDLRSTIYKIRDIEVVGNW